MKEIILNAGKMTSIKEAHSYIGRKLHFPDYYGCNLDALWDMLCTVCEPLSIRLINKDKLHEYLGDYAEPMISVFSDAALENINIYFRIE